MKDAHETEGRVAIIGMSGRFPGARNLDEFWSNLRGGVESIRYFSEEELLAAGESIDNIRDPAYVPAAAVLDDIDLFDAAFFGMSPRDAAVFDPQHRIFLECAWETFENAGYVGERIDGAVGVFASCGLSEYMFKNVLANEQVKSSVGEWLIRHTGNDTNFLATRVSYEMDLRGPSINVQTACSSTLVAVHLACQSLLSGECDMALAGGAVVAPVQHHGYFYKEGEILSPDGHCRAFDAKSAGTIISSASGCVLLKPLADAIDDGDHVLAVIRGSAINNDGRAKVGYLAPSVSGQARVVAEALAVSGVDARDVSYVEAHGTGTLIGDPIEIAGLTQAYRQSTDDVQFCAIGSLKTNIGHTGEASGVAALIKTVLALQHHEIPPSLHYESPNPQADFPSSPFFVNAELRPWKVENGRSRIAGITGLGAGGTNAHIVVEEWNDLASTGTSRESQLITVSARTPAALDRASAELAAHLRSNPALDLADVAFTRLQGRKSFRSRRAIVASSTEAAANALESSDPRVAITNQQTRESPSVVFMMPGGGAQYAGMGRDLYEQEPVYRDAIDACSEVVNPTLGSDLRTLLYPSGDTDAASTRLERPSVALPALFATAYAMATLLEWWDIVPSAMIGHSAGEYVAACLSGVISMEDGMRLVALRGRLFETLPSGGMLSVSLPEDAARERLPDGLSIAAVNAPNLCVVSGPVGLIAEMEAALAADDIDTVRVHIDVAAHSSMLEPILDEFGSFCRTIRFSPPRTPYVSNLTGTWITAAEATDPDYWVRHLREAVRFSEGIETILADPSRVLLEVGPGRTLASFARQASSPAVGIAPTLRHPQEESSDVAFVLGALGRVWVSGVALDTDKLFEGEARRRVPLPTYPFEKQRYWVDPDPVELARPTSKGPLRKHHDITDWFYTSSWRRSVAARPSDLEGPSTVMVISDGAPLAADLRARLNASGDRVISVVLGERFQRLDDSAFEISPAHSDDWIELIAALRDSESLPDRIVHLTAVGPSRGRRRFGLDDNAMKAFDSTVERDHASLVFLGLALSGLSQTMHLVVVTSGVHSLGGDDELRPERALLHGACRVIPRELGQVSTVCVDIDLPTAPSAKAALVDHVVREIMSDPTEDVVVYRRGERWVRDFERLPLPAADGPAWRDSGVYLITGGLGGIGLALADHIARSASRPTLVLVGRSAIPDESEWPGVLDSPTTDAVLRSRLEAVQRIRSLGADVILASADVTDIEQMRDVVGRVLDRKGAITGVIHAAGILRDALIALRTPHPTSPVIDVKAKGIMIIDEVLAKHPPELMVLCSSVSSLIGLPGQVDYTAANAFLDAYAIKRNLDGCTRAIAVNWSAWQEVGMAVDAAKLVERKAELPSPLDAPASPVLLFDDVVDEGDDVFLTGVYSRDRRWLLGEHVVRGGDALIPGTGYLELIRNAVCVAESEAVPVELRDVFFLTPFAVAVDEQRTLRIKIEREDSNVVVFSEAEVSPHATATASVIAPSPAPRHDLDEVRARCGQRVDEFDGYSDQAFMEFGPRWGNLRRVEYGANEALITTSMPSEFVDELQSLWLHPALLDMATGSAQALIPGFSLTETFYVPFSYGRVLVRRPLPATSISHVRLRESSVQDLAVFDIAICDEAGNEVVDIEGFTMRRVPPGAALTERRDADARPEPTPREAPINAALREGILSSEGVDALDRIVASEVSSQVVATSIDLHQWIAKVDAEATSSGAEGHGSESSGPQFERPNISSAFVPPATPIERELATMWRELLGVEQVGRNDDFFELGGQSLIAVRLFNRIRKRYAVDLPLATLFEAPTIAQCAAIVASNLGIVDEPAETRTDVDADVDADADTATDTRAPRAVRQPAPFRSLVTIQKGSDDRIPFFCVHGSGGNVLNFRDLSMAMGRTQPFYGVQARGIDGALKPHESIELMASAYLDEIRSVQPHGPYVLGGYSGGGLVAFEMAHQLVAAGEPVALVVLLDTFPPVVPSAHTTIRQRLHRVRDEGFDYLRFIVTRRLDARHRSREMERLDEILARGEVVPVDLREKYVERNFVDIACKYVLRPYRGRVTLLRAEDLYLSYRALGAAYGWDEVVEEGFELVYVPGNHDTLVLEPNATRVVQSLRDTIDSAGELMADAADSVSADTEDEPARS